MGLVPRVGSWAKDSKKMKMWPLNTTIVPRNHTYKWHRIGCSRWLPLMVPHPSNLMPKTLCVHGERGAHWNIVPVGLTPTEWDSMVDVGALHLWDASIIVAWWVLWPHYWELYKTLSLTCFISALLLQLGIDIFCNMMTLWSRFLSPYLWHHR